MNRTTNIPLHIFFSQGIHPDQNIGNHISRCCWKKLIIHLCQLGVRPKKVNYNILFGLIQIQADFAGTFFFFFCFGKALGSSNMLTQRGKVRCKIVAELVYIICSVLYVLHCSSCPSINTKFAYLSTEQRLVQPIIMQPEGIEVVVQELSKRTEALDNEDSLWLLI